jgi:hypothetical protein
MLARPRTRLMVKYRSTWTGRVGGIGNGEDPVVVVMDDVDAEHLRIPVPRASAA